MKLPLKWSAYLRVQADLSRRVCVDDIAWGLEAGLDRLLERDADEEEIARTIRSGARQDRHRARARRISARALDREHAEDARFEARHQLAAIRALTSSADWEFLAGIGRGIEFSEVAAAANASEGSLRVRAHRIRRTLRLAFDGHGAAREAA